MSSDANMSVGQRDLMESAENLRKHFEDLIHKREAEYDNDERWLVKQEE